MDAVAPGTKMAPELIQGVIRARAEAFKGCYDEALRRDPQASGKVTVRFSILADGAVEDAKVEGATGTDQAMVSCVVGAVSDARFPASSAGRVMVIYPLVFSR
jgi:outer membrane biosynthesis protein TonB